MMNGIVVNDLETFRGLRAMRNTEKKERISAGSWLRKRRIDLDLTQREVAAAVGLPYYTMISQIEAGTAKVPSNRYADYARALKMSPQDFVRELLKHYDPEAWKILWGGRRDIGGSDPDHAGSP